MPGCQGPQCYEILLIPPVCYVTLHNPGFRGNYVIGAQLVIRGIFETGAEEVLCSIIQDVHEHTVIILTFYLAQYSFSPLCLLTADITAHFQVNMFQRNSYHFKDWPCKCFTILFSCLFIQLQYVTLASILHLKALKYTKYN